jgi:glycosyltransferase involved in cell wall biosynthesis
MALGLPVISTNVGGMPHLIEHGKNGLLVPKNDAMAFVKAILDVRSNTELQKKLVFNARKKVESFDWKVIRLKWQETLT